MDRVNTTSLRVTPYLSGLDGLRAASVFVVMAYHAEVAGFDGGYLGVEVFFVISGFLITRLLLAEWDRTGRIDLKAFWIRRARRLLPAVAVLLAGVGPLMMVFAPDSINGLRTEIVAAAGYVTNWFLIFDDRSYFETFARPSPLRHLWSLAVEEQFYVIWPLAAAGALRLGGRRLALRVAVLGALASAGWAAWLSFAAEAGADPTRLYFGSDTRAAGLLIGAALALSGRTIRRFAGLWATAAVLVLIAGMHFLSGTDPLLFRGGLLAVSLATVVLLAVVAAPAASINRVLGWGPLAAMGQRSYALYLWHWPVVVLTRPRLDTTLDGLRLHLIQLTLSFVLAELSYRIVEEPIRRGRLSLFPPRHRRRRATYSAPAAMTAGRLAGRAAMAVLALALVIIGLERVQSPALASSGNDSSYPSGPVVPAEPAGRVALAEPAGPVMPAEPASRVALAEPASRVVLAEPASRVRVFGPPAPPAARFIGPLLPVGAHAPVEGRDIPKPPPGPPLVVSIGDSVMRGAAPELEAVFPGIVIDAETNRSDWKLHTSTPEQVAAADVVVVHLGQNGVPTAAMIDALLSSLDPTTPVVLLTVRAPVRWESDSNSAIRAAARRWPNVRMADWHTYSNEQYDWFIRDGVHLRPVGKEAYARFLLAETTAAVAETR